MEEETNGSIGGRKRTIVEEKDTITKPGTRTGREGRKKLTAAKKRRLWVERKNGQRRRAG
ncbi:uncharacterized protein G2W53_001532 [Senna tora]|uniref:Uncharacterized protein n=1 Tax=Senna tora TaxID=362788 RepID=A0A834XI75_9FABA|nr:uncharacterized protein G2W53_001532 [Senna tora]